MAGCLEAQAQKVSFNAGSVTLKVAFQKIEAVSAYKIAYNGSQLDVNRKVVLNQQNKEVLDVLTQILSGTGFTYSVKGKYIVIAPQQDEKAKKSKRISGKIVDETGELIIGANGLVAGTTQGTITDLDGNFALGCPKVGCWMSLTSVI